MMKALLSRLRVPALILGLGGAILVLLLVTGIDRALGQDVLLIQAHDEGTVELNRSLFLEGDPVAEIYGNPLSQAVRVISPDKSRLLRPAEDESLLLLQVDKRSGENPLQAQTLWFFAKFAVPVLLLLGLVGLFLPRQGSGVA